MYNANFHTIVAQNVMILNLFRIATLTNKAIFMIGFLKIKI